LVVHFVVRQGWLRKEVQGVKPLEITQGWMCEWAQVVAQLEIRQGNAGRVNTDWSLIAAAGQAR
jgi:hypothetical protein